jgi:hypothetical protein
LVADLIPADLKISFVKLEAVPKTNVIEGPIAIIPSLNLEESMMTKTTSATTRHKNANHRKQVIASATANFCLRNGSL